MANPARCPQCENRVIRKARDGSLEFRIKWPLSVTPEGLVKAQCHWCKTTIDLPLELASPELRDLLEQNVQLIIPQS
jgi:hypothetical protein